MIKKLKAEFVTKAESYHGYKPETSAYIYEKMIMPAADYSFNKSHAACYALIAYQTAYLKTHYPTAFHAALLRSAEEDPERLSQLIDELATQGVRVNPPDINLSFAHVAAIDDQIYL